MEALETHGKKIATVLIGLALGTAYRYYRTRRSVRRRDNAGDWYDLVIKLDDFMSVCHKGWLVDDRRVDLEQWRGTIVTVLGEFNRGKTWILNRLTGTKLPTGVNIRTEGLSFKRLTLARKEIALLDTAGGGSPVRSVTTGQLQQKKATEKFLRDVVFECADIFLYVVNDISAEEQIQLHSLALSLEQSCKDDKRIIVIHNLRERVTEEDMQAACTKIVDMYVSTGCYAFTPEEVMDDTTGIRHNIDVLCGLKEHRIAKYQMHLFIGQEGSPAGKRNNAVFSKLRQILNMYGAREEYHIQQKILQSFSAMLPKYIEGPPMQLCLFPDDNNHHPVKYLTVIPEDKYLSLETRGLLKRILRICKQERASDFKSKQLQSYIPRLLDKCPELAEPFASLLGWENGNFSRVPLWDAAVKFLEKHISETQPLDCDADLLLQPGESAAEQQSRWWGKDDPASPEMKDSYRFNEELEVGLYRLKPQPLPYFLSAEQTDGNTPAFTVSETAEALWFTIELPGVTEPKMTFRPLVSGGGFMFSITAWKVNPLLPSEVLCTHSDSRIMGSPTRPLKFQFVVPSIFELPMPDHTGRLPSVGEFRNGVLSVRFKKLPEMEQTVSVGSEQVSGKLSPPPTPILQPFDPLLTPEA